MNSQSISDAKDIIDLLEIFVQLLIIVVPWVVNKVKWHGISAEARKIASAFHSYSWINLNSPFPYINQIGEIRRTEISQIRNLWDSSDSCVLLHGEAGTGKSLIALRLGQLISNDGIPLLFLTANELSNGQDPIPFLQNRLALNLPLVDSILTLSKERPCAIIVDQLDNVLGTDLFKGIISFIKTLAGLQRVNILIVSRSYEVLQSSEISSLGFTQVYCEPLSFDQAEKYLLELGFLSPPKQLIDLATNLLNLSLISDIKNFSKDESHNILDEIDLWTKFFATIQQREGEETANFLLQIARETTMKGERTFIIQFPEREHRRKLLSRGILKEFPGRRYSFRHERLQNFLCAYSLLQEQPTFSKLQGYFGENDLRGVITWLHQLYHVDYPNIEPDFVRDVLDPHSLPFYTRVSILDNLKKQDDPSVNVARIILVHLNNWNIQRYFFNDLSNPAWINPIYQSGYFINVPDIVEVKPGQFQLPTWPAGEYLARFADQYVDIVVDLVQLIRTQNWRVQETLLDMMLKIPPPRAAKLIRYIDDYLDGPFSGSLPLKMSALSEQLIESGMVNAAISILEIVIKPILDKNIGKLLDDRSIIRFRSDSFWVNDFCEKQLFKLIQVNPDAVLLTFEHQLVRSIELVQTIKTEDIEKWVGYYWRFDIPQRMSSFSEGDVIDILIDGLRDSLAEVCKQSITDGKAFLEKYLFSTHIIFSRVALFTLRTYGRNYPDLVNFALSQLDYLEKNEFLYEYQGLLRDQYSNASAEVRDRVITRLLEGPRDADSIAERYAQLENRPATDQDRTEARERWILYYFEMLRDHLPGEMLAMIDELSLRYGKPDVSEHPHFEMRDISSPPSPLTADEMRDYTFDNLKNYFLRYTPQDLFLNPRESLARTFQGVVSGDPDKYTAFAIYLIDPAIRFVYVYHYLSGIREAIKNKELKTNDEVITLCEYVVNQQNDPHLATSGNHEPGLLASQIEVAWLLEETLHSLDPYLNRLQLDRIRSLLVILAHHSDPKDEKEDENSFDPFNRSLNCIRGVAMHGLMHYSLFLIRQREKEENVKLKTGFLEPQIVEVLNEKLNLSQEPSLAVHSVFGAYFPQLLFLDTEWATHHLDDIFSPSSQSIKYWKAAWDAYLFASRIYPNTFKLLIPQYQKALKPDQLLDGTKKNIGSRYEPLARHIVVAYINGLTDFGHENRILDLFLANAPDTTKAEAVFLLSEVLDSEKPSADSEMWGKFWKYWQNRFNVAEIENSNNEISNFMRWLKNVPVTLQDLYPILNKSIKHFVNGFDVSLLGEYAAKNCQQYPLIAVQLLEEMIHQAKESWWQPEGKDEEIILQTAMKSDDPEAKRIAVDVINLRGEMGDFRWKNLLD